MNLRLLNLAADVFAEIEYGLVVASDAVRWAARRVGDAGSAFEDRAFEEARR
ncbi:MAG TPA: hypothetical protein VEW67_03910 [Thermoleophilaceae bacterium]|nr:hypothetical protein [Thermoleophilaceae bacterium]